MLYFKYATIAVNPWQVLLCSRTSQGAVHMDACEKRGEKNRSVKGKAIQGRFARM